MRILFAGLVSLILVGAGYFGLYLPDGGPALNVKIDVTPERIARGSYLSNHVAGCIACHSKQDESKLGYPIVPGSEGAGGTKFDGPGEYYAANLTAYHLSKWTDGEVLRAITAGVSRDGHALFPIMPYPGFGKMDEEDAKSIVVYLRTLKPIENEVPASRSNFPMNIIKNTIPAKPHFEAMPSKNERVKYGAYLANVSSCIECHSQRTRFGGLKKGLEYGGGQEFALSTGGIIRSANISPEPKTGIGSWTKEAFIARFKSVDNLAAKGIAVPKNSYNTVMPWISYAGMTEEDLGAIYEFLKSVKPVENLVDRFTPGAQTEK
jgi:mono/diheme cytochrome c family protein